MNAQIGAKKSWNGQYTVDCATVPDLPELSLYFDGKPYLLKGTDYILQVQGTCMSAFTGLDINLPDGGQIWIIGMYHRLNIHMAFVLTGVLGDVFLRKYYTVYDVGRNAVGFAPAK